MERRRGKAVERIEQWLARLARSRRLALRVALVGVLLTAPTLFIGLHLDDYVHRYFALGLPGSERLSPSYLSFFSIAPGDPAGNHALIEDGYAPYWMNEKLRLVFCRPLATLTHRLDYLLWPDSPFMMHAQSLVWFGAALFAAALLYRGILGPTAVAAFAALLFAVDHTHGLPVGWIANRNALIAACLGTFTLVAYQRRREGERGWVRFGPLLLVAGLLGGELALGAWAYLAAHALVLDRAPWRQRARALAPYAAVTVAWRVVYTLMGFGAFGSGLYLDPVAEPLAFIKELPVRIPLFVLGLFGLPPAEAHLFVIPELSPLVLAGAVVLTVALVVTLTPLLRVNRVARFWALGMALSIVPACTAIPHNRLVYFGALGAMPLLAILMGELAANAAWIPRALSWRLPARAFFTAVLGTHTLLSPILLPLAACNILVTRGIVTDAVPSALAAAHAPGKKDLIILSSPDYFYVMLIRIQQRLDHQPEIGKIRQLSVGAVPLRTRRLDPYRLEIEYEGGLLGSRLTRLYRDERSPIAPGFTQKLEGLTVQVTRVTEDGRPLVAVFTFAEPLDSARYAWVEWRGTRYEPIDAPGAGGHDQPVAAAHLPFEFGAKPEPPPHGSPFTVSAGARR